MARVIALKRYARGRERSEYFFDYSLLFIVLFLLGFGLVMIYSASSYTAFQDYGDSAQFMKKQLLAIILGLVAMVAVAVLDYHIWEKKVFTIAAYVLAFGGIIMVKTPLGISSHGATRWFKIPGLGMQVQPAEIAKLCMILVLARIVCRLGKDVGKVKGFLWMMIPPLPIALMIWKVTNNMSSALIVMAISFLMVFVASPRYKEFILMGLAGIAAAALVVWYAVYSAGQGNFRMKRIVAWLNPESQAQDTGFQTLQGLYAIGSGGIWGKGLGQSMQKLKFLPESQNDMIFSIICEELGLFGASAVMAMFIMLIWRMMVIANNASDLYGAMLVVGVIGHIAVQAILNIAVVTNTIPNTGISLPFISYGGSSVMFLLAEIGLVFSVARRIQLKDM
ncbi:MAG: cell division protein FtsW [Lachnospiraceae bacterium]|nr:cell division protein FtsW [Lachnospiraceae bacterium]